MNFSFLSFSQDQSASLGNIFIHSEGNLSVLDQHKFATAPIGSQPGIIGGEREPAKGYFNFGPDGGWINAKNTQYVDGYVRFCGNTSFLFPVGDNNQFRPAGVSEGTYVEVAYYGVNPSNAITSDIRGGNFPVLPGTGPFNSNQYEESVTNVSQYEYWDINGVDPAFITLTWNVDSNVDLITANALSNLTIVGWNGTQWEKIQSEVDVNSVNLNNSSMLKNGAISNMLSGSISSTIQVAPSDYEVYTLGAGCNEMIVSVNSDTIICYGDQILLSASSLDGSSFTWNNGEYTGPQIVVNPTESKYYTVEAELGNCSASNQVYVEVSNPSVDLGEDIYICRGEGVTIHAFTQIGMTYEWSNGTFGGDEITIFPNSSTTVSVTVTNSYGCQATDNVFVEVGNRPDVFVGRERSVCLGDSVFIQAFGSSTGYGYLWSTGDTSDIINVSPTVDTDYEVYLTENGCTDTAYVSVLVLQPTFVEITGDSIICP